MTVREPDNRAAGNGSRLGGTGIRLFQVVPMFRVHPVRAVPLAAFIPSRVPGRGRGAWGGFTSRSGGANQRGAVPAGWRGAE